MPEGPGEFATLLARAGQGDADALASLVRQYEPRVRLVARVLLGRGLRPYLDSVDLTQSVHRSLLLGLRHGKFALTGPEHLIALALTLVRRKVARHWRRLQRQQRLSGAGGGDPEQILAGLPCPEADPAREAQFKDQLRQLYGRLGPLEQRLVELRLQGHNTVELAQALGLHPVALRVRLTRLRQRLRDSGVLDDWL